MINVAVVGLGYWGPNLARNIAGCSDARLHTLCDARSERLRRLGGQYTGAKLRTKYDAVL